jgi:hypothetical protein
MALASRAKSPELKRDDAITALETRDAEMLIRLADPVEVATLKLTPVKVQRLLNQTLWQAPPARHVGITRVGRQPIDESLWETTFGGTHSGILRIIIPVIDTPGVGWKLNLSMMLRSSCYWAVGREEGPGLYRRLAKEVGITGLRQQEGDYVTIEVLEERTARLEAARRQR